MDFRTSLRAALGELHDRQAETIAELDRLLERFGPGPASARNTSELDGLRSRPDRLEGHDASRTKSSSFRGNARDQGLSLGGLTG